LDQAKPTHWIRLSVLLTAVFALKILAVVQLKDSPLIQPDSGLDTTAYATLADRVLGGDFGLGPGLYYVSPLYIYFLAGALAVLRSYTAVRVLQIALGTAGVGLIFMTARAWFTQRAAWIAAILAALTGLFTFYELLILQSSIDMFLTSAGLYALAAVEGWGALGAGIILGIQTLNRPNVLAAAIGLAIVASIAMRRIRPGALLAAGLLIGLSPVVLRNVVVSGQWSLVSSHGGLNFYIGNSPTATGFYQFIPGVTPTIEGQETDTRRIAQRAAGRSLTDAEVSDYFFGLGREWIREHPVDAAALFVRKMWYAFHAQHIALPHSYPFYAYDLDTVLRFLPVGAWLLTPLGLAGLAVAAPRDRVQAYLVWASFVPLYAAAVAIFFVAERYRLPLLVPLCIGAGALIDHTWSVVRARDVKSLALTAAAVCALFVAANWRIQASDGRWVEGLRLAQRLLMQHRDEEADRWIVWLETHNPPKAGAAHAAAGAELLVLNEPARALTELAAAHEADPADVSVDFALGQALLRLGQADQAVPHLRRGFEAGAQLPDGGLDYAIALDAIGDRRESAAAADRVNPSDPADQESWLRLGRTAMEAKAPRVAESFFRRAAAMRPGVAAARQQYGLNLIILGDCDGAARELGEAARLDPRDADTLSHLAYCEMKLDRVDAARTHVDAALAIDPRDPLATRLKPMLR
jgi:Flp pilus assembly protein TadD